MAELAALREQVETCTRCGLHATRTQAVFGEGDPRATLMFVGEAPGYHEDKQGRPFVGAAGKLLEDLLESIGLTRSQVFIANVLKSRPPNNRDPLPEEIEACKPYLLTQVGLIQPRVICSLGNFATKLLSGSPAGITRVHGHPQAGEIGGHHFYLYPIFHPAAALYTPSMLETLRVDFARLPDLLSAPAPGLASGSGSQTDGDGEQAQATPPQRPASHEQAAAGRPAAAAPDEQLGLF